MRYQAGDRPQGVVPPVKIKIRFFVFVSGDPILCDTRQVIDPKELCLL